MFKGERTIQLMGTTIQLWVSHYEANRLLESACLQLMDYEKRFSAHREDSQLAKISRYAGVVPVQVDQDLFDLIALGKAHSTAKNSYLNIAIGPLVKAWRIGFSDAKEPTAKEIAEVLKIINPEQIELDQERCTVFLSTKGMSLDLGALAKGYFADKIIEQFKIAGATAGFINLGGNVLTFGDAPTHEDGFWRIGIQHPQRPRGNYATVVKTKNQSIVTSGIYERVYKKDNKIFHHILDCTTGFPVNSDVASITVISKTSVMGEIWTTRLFGKSAASAIKELEENHSLAGIVLTMDDRMAVTKAVEVE